VDEEIINTCGTESAEDSRNKVEHAVQFSIM